MKRSLWLVLAAFVIAAGVTIWLVVKPGGDKVAIDLVKEFPGAKQQPKPDVFSVIDAKVGDATKRAIFTADPSRITWHVTIPENAWLLFSFATKEEGWTLKGDGVRFITAVSDAQGNYDQLLDLVINPNQDTSARRWHDMQIDLSQYAGETVDIIFNTRAGVSGDDRNGDLALWGAPRVVVR